MEPPLLELEGTAEEIRAQLPDFEGRRLHIIVLSAEPTPIRPHKQSAVEKILARAQETPLEERAKVPIDLTENLDHYIYGWPRN